ncbi:hypothetical protein APHAL10511_001757 [Amanita phalloides]|nr:hypothetical protein APHAL10511_001757 [Amanita phalloides]
MDRHATKLVYDIYQSTWHDFYRWEQKDYDRIIETLWTTPTTILLPLWMNPESASQIVGDEQVVSQLPNESHEMELVEYVLDGISTSRTNADVTFVSVALRMPHDLIPTSSYESCTPLERNFSLGDDPSAMPFVPFADDPLFDQFVHLDRYEKFSWQDCLPDPNLETIVLETLARCTEQGLTIQEIEETRILPLCKQLQQRDFPSWYHLQQAQPHEVSYLYETSMQKFCRLCWTGYCFTHLKPLITNSTLGHRPDNFCTPDCYLHLSTTETTWTPRDQEWLLTMLSYIPDATPCHLAKIGRKPCAEVFVHRRQMLPDEPADMQFTRRNTARDITKSIKFLDNDPKGDFVYNMDSPCSHDGPCTADNECPCNENGARCTSKCMCDERCPRRWKGCQCARTKSRMVCRGSKCPCFQQRHECIPDICLKCQATNACGNVQMQMSQIKRTSVRQSEWGFGLFVEEAVRKGELIDEYVGELIFEPTAVSRGDQERHRRRNYLFTLNSNDSNIDSTFAGNSTRFINHSNTEHNCQAQIWLIDGEQRIGIMALHDIEAGEELLMDYGEQFFIGDQEQSPGSELENVPDPEDADFPMTIVTDQNSLSGETYTDDASSSSG